jgi:Zn-dependent protease with chaperone function
MYAAQAFCHSAVAAVVADQALKAWRIQDPRVRQRFRLIVVFFPILSFPLYQILNPARGSALFRLGSLFDIDRWLSIEIAGLIPLSLLFLAVLAVSSLVFLLQEMLPVAWHALYPGRRELGAPYQELLPFIAEYSSKLSMPPPDVMIIDDDDAFLYSSTGKHPVIYLSRGLRESLPPEQLSAALAHELAHVSRSRRPLLILVFLFRMVMFFNPIVLLKFRRIVMDEEKICDDIAVSLTGDPAALAAALRTFIHDPADDLGRMTGPRTGEPSLEDYGHALHLESRIRRLEAGPSGVTQSSLVPFAITLATIAAINYYVV